MSPDTPSKPDPQAQNSKPEWWLVRVPDDADDSRFDRFLRRLVPGLPQGDIERMLRSGLIRLDGVKAKPATRLASGQEVRLPPHLHTVQKSSKKPPANKDGRDAAAPRRDKELVSQFESMIIAEGSDWLALNKPSGLAVQGGTGTRHHIDGMLMALAADDPESRMRLVHRIDKDTSGILILAKDRQAARRLTADFQRHNIEKTYLALVVGVPPKAMSIRHPLAKQPGRNGEKMMVTPDGQPAHTEARRLDAMGRKLALMALRPLTGRTHQLRVHMAHEGFAIAGDGKYGGAEAHPGGIVARKLHLHAWRLQLADGTLVEAPLSNHMNESLSGLGLQVPKSEWPFED